MKISAQSRNDTGKGASRRLRHQERVPGIIYGAGKKPENIMVNIHEITHLLENEDAYTSILDLNLDKVVEAVIIKDLQRHPAKNIVTHIDFLRINKKQAIVTRIPLNYIGEEDNEAMRLGAVLNQFIDSVEVSCLPADLPHGINVDISKLELGDHLSLTDINIPKGVELIILQHDDVEAHNQSIAAVQEAKKMAKIEDDIVGEEVAEGEEGAEGEEDVNTDDKAQEDETDSK